MSGLSTTPTFCMVSLRAADSANALARPRPFASNSGRISFGSCTRLRRCFSASPASARLGVHVVSTLPLQEVRDLVPDKHVGGGHGTLLYASWIERGVTIVMVMPNHRALLR